MTSTESAKSEEQDIQAPSSEEITVVEEVVESQGGRRQNPVAKTENGNGKAGTILLPPRRSTFYSECIATQRMD
eukprot:10208754-Ditylum_brightwellii.AAC.1